MNVPRWPRYSENKPCPKCGCMGVSTKYERLSGALNRTCSRCGYWWREKANDAAS